MALMERGDASIAVEGLSVAKVAKALGVSRVQLMNWESLGLITPQRVVNPYSKMPDRIYGENEVKRLRFIKALKGEKGEQGLGLEAIKLCLEYMDTGHIALADETWKSL